MRTRAAAVLFLVVGYFTTEDTEITEAKWTFFSLRVLRALCGNLFARDDRDITEEQNETTAASDHCFTLGHRPDSDDAFMFYAMAKKMISLHDSRFERRLENIQTRNERARRGELHISVSPLTRTCTSGNYALCPAEQVWGTNTESSRERTSNVEHRKIEY